jgi:ATP synthase protein I
MLPPPAKKPPEYPDNRIRQASLLATASAIGLSLVIAIALGAIGGYFLDRWLGTRPWGFVGGLLLGIVAGFRNIFILAERLERAQAEEKKKPSPDEKDH